MEAEPLPLPALHRVRLRALAASPSSLPSSPPSPARRTFPCSLVLLIINLISIALTLTAARAVLRRVTPNERAQLAGIATLAAVWTIPIAGTSLLLMDPCVTARSLSTPLSVWAVAFALDDWRDNRRSLAGCILAIAFAAAFHPLMAGYALGLIIVLRILRSRRKILLLAILRVPHLRRCRHPADPRSCRIRRQSSLQQRAATTGSSRSGTGMRSSASSGRSSFCSRSGATTTSASGQTAQCSATAAILYGCFATALALVFGQEHFHAHIVARLQPLRAFLTIYLIMFLLLGTSMQQVFERASSPSSARHYTRYAMIPILLATAFVMFIAQRSEFPASAAHRASLAATAEPQTRGSAPSSGVATTQPQNALFALDAHYITTPGEDAQTFRAIAQRSVLPDFSKDGGEAAITPRLADEWAAGFTAQLNLDQQTASQLRERLVPYGVDWVILRSDSPAALSCPYDNNLLKVCKLHP